MTGADAADAFGGISDGDHCRSGMSAPGRERVGVLGTIVLCAASGADAVRAGAKRERQLASQISGGHTTLWPHSPPLGVAHSPYLVTMDTWLTVDWLTVATGAA